MECLAGPAVISVLAGEQGQGGEFANKADGFKADGDDLADQADDVFGSSSRLGSLTMPKRFLSRLSRRSSMSISFA